MLLFAGLMRNCIVFSLKYSTKINGFRFQQDLQMAGIRNSPGKLF